MSVFFLLLANKKGVRICHWTEPNAPPWLFPKTNVEENWAPPNYVEHMSDEIETITNDVDMSGNIAPKVSPRIMSNLALTSFEEKSSNAMNRYVFAESPD